MKKPGPLLAVIAAALVAFACDPKTPAPPNPPKPITQSQELASAAHAVFLRRD